VFGLNGQTVNEARTAGAAATPEQQAAVTADQQGDRETLKADAYIPALMAAIYLGLLLYFKATGGYRRVEMKS